MKKDKTIVNCNFIKTILMLCVILYHSMVFWSGAWFTKNPIIDSNGLSLISYWLKSFHMYAFALVSGYIFAFKILVGGYNHYGLFLKNKARRLIVPYIFVMLIWVVPISAYYLKPSATELFRQYVLCINPSQLWFLWMLFGVFAIVWPLRNVMIKKPFVGWTISLIFWAIGIMGGYFIPDIFCVWTACQYVIFFYMGMRIRTKIEKQERLVTDAVPCFCWVVIHIILFVMIRLMGQQDGFIWNVIAIGMDLLLHIVGAMKTTGWNYLLCNINRDEFLTSCHWRSHMAWTGLKALASHINWQGNRRFKTLTSYSMPMYLFHQQIIYFTITALNGVVNPWINAGVNFVAALGGSFLISALMMKWKVTRVLIGEKS